MRDNILFSDGQARTDPDITGTRSTDHFDLEQDSAGAALITDDQVECFVNVVITAVSFTSGGDEGIILEVRTDDSTNHSSAQIVIGSKEVPLAEIVAGAKIPIPVVRNVMKRYMAGWLRAKSTQYIGTITIDQYHDIAPIGPNETLQKVPA